MRNADGTHSTELSITVTDPRLNSGRPTNIPSMWNRQVLPDEQAVTAALQSGQQYPAFESIGQAVTAARARSDSGGAGAPGGFDPSTARLASEVVDFDPSTARPVRRVGGLEATLRTAAMAVPAVVQMVDLAAASVARAFGDDAGADAIFADMEQRQQRLKAEYAPQPDEDFGTLAQIAGGVLSMPIELAGGMGLQRGVARAADVVQRGGSLEQAGQAGAVTGGVNLGLNLLPVKAGGRVAQALESRVGGALAGAATGAAINLPAQIAGASAENVALPGQEGASLLQRAAGDGVEPAFADLSRDPLDTEDLAVGAGLAGAFGGLAGAAGRNRRRGPPADARRGSGDTPVPAARSFDEAVASGQLQPAELSDASGYLTPNGAFVTRADWDGASERVRAGWMRPEAPPQGPEAAHQEPSGEPVEAEPVARNSVAQQGEPPGVTQEAIPVGEATELHLRHDGQPAPDAALKAAEGQWREEHRFGTRDGDAAKAVADAMDLDPDAVERAVTQHTRSPRAFEREIARILDEGTTRESAPEKAVRGSQGLETDSVAAADDAAALPGRPWADGDAAAGAPRSEPVRPGRQAAEEVEDRRALHAVQERLGRQIGDALSLELVPHRQRAQESFGQADRWRLHAADVAEQAFGKRVVYFTSSRPLAAGLVQAADPGRIFINARAERPELAILGHELTHTLRMDRPELFEGLRQGLGSILRDESGYGTQLNTWRAKKGLQPLDADALNEEMVADIVGDHFVQPAFWRAMQQAEQARFRELGQRVVEWIDGALQRLAGVRPFKSDRFVSDLRKARQVVVRAMADYSRGAGGERLALDAGAASVTESPAFKRWFGNSKVVDHRGQPRVMYHGTSRSQDGEAFSSFDTYGSEYGLFGQGSYFTADPGVASSYTTKGRGSSPAVYPVFLSIKNPMVMEDRATRQRWSGAFPDVDFDATNGQTNEAFYRAVEEHLSDQQLPKWEGAEVMQEGLRSMGHDGIAHIGGGRRRDAKVRHHVYIAFDPEQIKSATGNRGTFNPASADIRLSLDEARAADQRLAEMPEETRAELLTRKLFDRFNRVGKMQDLAGVRGDDADITMADRLYYGRVQNAGDKLERDFLDPLGGLLRKAGDDGLTVRDADDFLMALHAPERNRVIAERNPKMPDGGSGLTTKQAREIVDSFTPAQRRHLDAVAALVHRMNNQKLDGMVDAGLISAATRDALRKQYRHYVPLKTLDEEDAARGIGRGYEMRASDITTALGRSSKAGSPIAASVMDASRAILRGEKARVDRTIWQFAQHQQAAAFMRPYDPDSPPRAVMGREIGPDGQVREVVDSQKVRDLTITLVVDGEQRRVFVPDELLRDQIRKVAALNDPGPVLRAIGRGTSLIGRLLTEYNPAFTIPNAARDAITVGMRSTAHGLNGSKVVAGIPSAWKAIVDHQRGAKTEGARLYAEFLDAGAKTGAYGLQDVDTTMRRLERAGAELGYADRARGVPGKLMDALRDVGDVVSRANEVVEYASRFSLYRTLRAKGEGAQRAAEAAKEITVNFSRSGEYGRTLNSLLVFANAALQGLYGTVAYARSAGVRRNMLGMVALGAAVQMYNELAGGEDERTGDPNINSQSDGIADRNLVLLQPGERSGVKVPLPPEYAALYAIGRRLWRAASQGDLPREAAGVVGAVLDGTLPVRVPEASNPALGAARAVVPTLLTPFADLFVNESYFGSPIVPEREFDRSPPPAHTIAWRSTSDIAKATSELLNAVTGGDDIEPGHAQKALGPIVSPEGIEHLVKFYTGGLGATAMLTTNMVRGMADGEAHDINKTPIANRFIFAEPKSYISRRYRELAPTLEYAEQRQKKGQVALNQAVDRALPEFKAAEREIRRLRTQMRDADGAELERLRGLVREQQARVIRVYNGKPAAVAP